jgi:hypothetical protein
MKDNQHRGQDYLLQAFQTTWVLGAITTFILVISSISPRFQQLSNISPEAVIPTGQLRPIEAQALAEMGLSVEFYAGWITFLEVLAAVEFLLLGLVVFLLRRNEWMPLIFAMAMIGLGAYVTPLTSPLDEVGPQVTALTSGMRALIFSSLIVAFLLFPNGQFLPNWTKGLAFIWITYNLASLVYQPLRMANSMVWVESSQFLLTIWAFLWLVVITILQVNRYRRHSSSIERQQTKWVVFGLALAVMAMVGIGFPFILLPVFSTNVNALIISRLITVTVTLLSLSLMGASIAVAILRYRLWDIDLIIRRTVIYGALTLTLLLIYFASVILLQHITQQVTGESSSLAVIFSTLVIAAMFSPLKRRIQNDIDRRFYRKKYDAARTLAEFAAATQVEVDLELLTNRLVDIVEDAMQPEHISVWLK